MVKNWADHCSSDEEDVHIHHVAQREQREQVEVPKQEEPAVEESPQVRKQNKHQQHHRPTKTYEFPAEPPFTAYVGNLAFNVDQPQRLAEEITSLAKEHLGLEISIVSARVAIDRRGEKPRHRGFGYVEVENVEQLKSLMELNEKEGVTLAGRRVQVDTANARSGGGGKSGYRMSGSGNRDSGVSDVDGSKFRGGRHSNSNRRSGGGGRPGSNSANNEEGAGETPPAHRTSLQLQPRTKPLDEGGPSNDSSSNIFGSGRARDEQAWQERHKSDQKSSGEQHDRRGSRSGNKDRRGSAGRGGGRGGGRVTKDNANNKSSKPEGTKQDEKKSPPPAKVEAPKAETKKVPAKVEAPKAETKNVTNKFAALGFDSDSD